jgi:uncharacterized membrane protein YphA (DoxX/SURF4 family)
MNPVMHLSGRILLASIFIISGLGKLANPSGRRLRLKFLAVLPS